MTRVAMLGIGTMGLPMAVNLARAGFQVHAWNRSPGRTGELEALGAQVAPTPAEAAAPCDVVVTMLTGAEAVDQVLFGPDGAAHGDVTNKLFVDMSTSGPRSARSVASRLHGLGARFVDAPVSGTRGPAERGELVVLAGGDEADLRELDPLFDAVGKRVIRCGGVGSGQTLKVVLNGLGCQLLTGYVSMLRLGERAGLAREVLVAAFSEGAFAAPAYVGKRARVLERRYDDPDFVLGLVLKDAELCAELQAELDAPMATHAAALAEVRRGVEAGLGELDLFALEALYDGGRGEP